MKIFEIDITLRVEVPDNYAQEDAVADVQFSLSTVQGVLATDINSVYEETQ